MRHDVAQIGELEAETWGVVTHLLFGTSTRETGEKIDCGSE